MGLWINSATDGEVTPPANAASMHGRYFHALLEAACVADAVVERGDRRRRCFKRPDHSSLPSSCAQSLWYAYRRAGYASPGSSESALETLAGLPDSRPASRRRRRESAYQMMRGHICEGQGKWLNALAQFQSTHPARPCHALRGLGLIFYPPTPLNLTRPAP